MYLLSQLNHHDHGALGIDEIPDDLWPFIVAVGEHFGSLTLEKQTDDNNNTRSDNGNCDLCDGQLVMGPPQTSSL